MNVIIIIPGNFVGHLQGCMGNSWILEDCNCSHKCQDVEMTQVTLSKTNSAL